MRPKSATRQKVEQVVADAERFRAQLASREADLVRRRRSWPAGKPIWPARAPTSAARKAELEAQKRQRAVLDSQELLLHADLNAKRATARAGADNLGYTRIVAPENGIVSERKVRAGTTGQLRARR